jgi:hypothetical protein
MKKLYIHAGLPKNGTSALQVFFAKNQKQLLEQGIEYFRTGDINEAEKGNITSGNGGLLARSMLNQNHEAYYKNGNHLYKEILEKIKNSNTETGLLSSEFFAVIPLSKITEFKESLLNIHVELHFIYYVRRQDQYLMSTYMQRVKRHGFTENPNNYLKSIYKNIHFLNYFGYFNQIENILGNNKLSVFIYETTKNHPKGLIGHFSQKLFGECPDWVKTDPIINTSPSPLEIKLMLMANQYSPRMQFSDFIVADSILSGRSNKYMTHNIVSNEVSKEILNHFDDQNKKFENKFAEGHTFPKPLDKDYINLESLSFKPEEVMDIVSGFLVRFDRRLTKLESNR